MNVTPMPIHQNGTSFVPGTHRVNALLSFVDWTCTPVGLPENWPSELKNALSLILNTHQPMALWWGGELIHFYNDAYRDLLPEAQRDTAFGLPVRTVYPEAWNLVQPQIDFVMSGQGSTWHENQKFTTLEGDSTTVERWWTYGYSPIYVGASVGGILVVCTETTKEQLARMESDKLTHSLAQEVARRTLVETQLRAERVRLDAVLDTLPTGLAIVGYPEGTILYQNPKASELLGMDQLPKDAVQDIEKNYTAIHPDGRPYEADEYPSVMAFQIGRQIGPVDMLYQRGDERIILTVRSSPVYDPQGRLDQVVTIFDEVTQTREVEKDKLLYRAIASHIPHGAVFLVDSDLRYVLADGPALRNTGLDSTQFEGKHLSQVVPPSDLPTVIADYETMLRGEPVFREHEAGGRHFATYGTYIPCSNGPHLALAVSYDVTDRLQREARLQLVDKIARATNTATTENEVLLHAVQALGTYLDAAFCGFAEVRGTTSTYRGWARDGQKALTGSLRPAWVNSVRDELDQSAEPVFRNEEVPFEFPLKPGLPGRFSQLILPILTEGRVVACLVIGRQDGNSWSADDVSLARQVVDGAWAKADRLRLIEQLRRMDLKKDRFLATLAHEIRNPLGAIVTGTNLLSLLPSTRDEVVQMTVERIKRQLDLLRRLVDDLTDISRIKHGKIHLQTKRFDLREAIELAVDMHRPLLSKRDHSLEMGLGTEPCYVHADKDRMVQVAGNLLNNAAKYTPQFGAITVELERSRSAIMVHVKDNGIGIEPEAIRSIFEIFVQDDHRAPTMHRDGLGIGLALVKHLVQLQGGEVAVTSAGRGKGSCFTVSLPVAEVQ